MAALPQPARVDVVDDCRPREIPPSVFESETPLLLRGLVADWPAVRVCRESLASAASYLMKFWSGRPVTVYIGDGIDGRFFYNDDFTGFNFRRGTAPLGQVFDKLSEQPDDRTAQSIYVGSTAVDHWLPGFREQNDLALPFADALASFWLGNRTRVSAHFDFPNNVACVLAGRRRFTLFPPEQVRNLYVGPLDRTPSGQAISLVDLSNPDFEKYPRFREALAAAFVCDLGPGDAVFVPSMWWHNVESFDAFNLLVNYWWCDSLPASGAPTAALMHAILALRDLPPAQRRAWRGLFDHYVFSADESVHAHIPATGKGCLAPLDDAAARKLRAELLNKLNQ